MKNMSRRKKTILVFTAAFTVIALCCAYVAADRFLIPHVEGFVSETIVSEDEVISSVQKAVTTKTDYDNGKVKISISKVSKTNLVYFVADITLSSGTDLKSAFAKNQFGTNIIQNVSVMAKAHNAVFAINGDYYGFRDDGIIIRNGVLYRDDGAREGLAIYKDGTMKVYDETKTTGEALIEDGVWNTLSFGPALVKNGDIVSGIDSVEIDTNFGNHSVQGSQPRTGIGIIDKNHFIIVVADGRTKGYSSGVTMTEFADIFKGLGCTTAYNLDGGGSSEMWFNGSVVNRPCNGNGKERGTSDIIYIAG